MSEIFLRLWRRNGAAPCQTAIECSVTAVVGRHLDQLLKRVTLTAPTASFVLIHLPSTLADAEVDDVIRAAARVRSPARLCLAADAAVVERMQVDLPSNVGLLLDNIDITTPLSTLVASRMEAIRFAPAFVARADRDLRQLCALSAMCELARDLGVSTFGADDLSGAGQLGRSWTFDYAPVAALEASPPRRRSRVQVRSSVLI